MGPLNGPTAVTLATWLDPENGVTKPFRDLPMHIGRFKPLVAVLLLSGAAGVHASVNPEIGFSCSDTLSINDLGGLQVGCSGDLRVFGNGPEAVLSHPEAIVLRASASLRLDDLRIIAPQITLDAPQLLVGPGAHLDASGARTGQGAQRGQSGPLTLLVGGDVRLGSGLDPNRVTVATTVPGGVVMSVGFQASASISGSSFGSDTRLSAWPSPISGQVSGAFFGPVGTSSGVIDVTSPGPVGSSGGGRYTVPFLLSKSVTGTLSPVPEPSTWALLLAGLGLTAFTRRRA